MRENTNGPLPWQEEFWRCQSPWPVLWEQMIVCCYFQILLMTMALWNSFFFFYLFYPNPLDRRLKEKEIKLNTLKIRLANVDEQLLNYLMFTEKSINILKSINTKTDYALKWCWSFLFLFVSAGCVQLISSVSLKCVQPSVAISWQRISYFLLKY